MPIDKKLIEGAGKFAGQKTEKEAVAAALSEYIARRNQLKIIEVFGTIDFDPNYDYKSERRAKR